MSDVDPFGPDAPQSARDAFDDLPEPPHGMNDVTSCVWFASALLKVAAERRWNRDVVRQAFCFFLARTLAEGTADDEVIVSELRDALQLARASGKTRQ